LHVLAVWISAAGDELAVTAMTQHHVAPAFRANLFQRNIRNFLALIETARGFALRISGASHELTEPAALQNHRASAVLAIFLLRSLLQVGIFQIRKIDDVLFRERATVWIVLVVGAAGKE